ncbi:MAG: hypothetical protein ACRD4R_06815 [Candidatus Acidiferrales bacterium]
MDTDRKHRRENRAAESRGGPDRGAHDDRGSSPEFALLGDEITCIGCGCTDSHACVGGCSWAAVDDEVGLGICSRCAEIPIDELVNRQMVRAIAAAL